jgi:hypothetical protein
MRKLATAASESFGSDCYVHATIAQAILAKLGVEAKLVAGYAAWRVGNGDSDVILHAPAPGMVAQPGGIAYHVWLEVGNKILDLTTYQLREKAAQLDELDGGSTHVTWCPIYLFVFKKSVSSLRDVTQLGAGLYYYSQEPAVEAKVMSTAPNLDEDDVETVWLLYQNQGMVVFGPNDIQAMQNKGIKRSSGKE